MPTHFQNLTAKKRTLAVGIDVAPSSPQDGDFFFDNQNNQWAVFYQSKWWYRSISTTTSTSTSTTTTSTSTTTTSTSTSTTTSTSTSTTTSTTTTL